jgi:hypothetical protein
MILNIFFTIKKLLTESGIVMCKLDEHVNSRKLVVGCCSTFWDLGAEIDKKNELLIKHKKVQSCLGFENWADCSGRKPRNWNPGGWSNKKPTVSSAYDE